MATFYHQGKLLSISRWILPGVVETATPPCVFTLVAPCPHHALYTMSRVCHFGCDGEATKDGLLCCCGVCVCRRASRLRNTLLHTSTKLSTKWWSITRKQTKLRGLGSTTPMIECRALKGRSCLCPYERVSLSCELLRAGAHHVCRHGPRVKARWTQTMSAMSVSPPSYRGRRWQLGVRMQLVLATNDSAHSQKGS